MTLAVGGTLNTNTTTTTTLCVLQNAYKSMASRHPLLMKASVVGDICLFVCLDFPWGKIPLKSIIFMKKYYLLSTVYYENQYLSTGKENSTSQFESL